MSRQTVVIIQARLGSTRLPGKVLKDIFGKPMLWHMINRLKYSKEIDDIVLAIPDSPGNDPLKDFARGLSLHCFRGSEMDVLSRYYGAATKFGARVVVRVTSDCPLIDPQIVDQVIAMHIGSNVYYKCILYMY